MTATALCNIGTGCGISEISRQQHHLIAAVRKKLLISTRQVEDRSCCSYRRTQKRFNKICGVLLKAKREDVHVKCWKVVNTAPVEDVKEGEDLSREALIWRAIKLPIYTVALVPVTVATAAAYWQTGQFSIWRYLMILASYILINVWANLSNDVYDFDAGADKNKKESVINLFGNRTIFILLAWSALLVGSLGLISIAILAGSPRSIVLLASAVFCFYVYQCPPFRLSYYSMGEPLSFLTFGPLSTIAFYLLYSRTSELAISSVIVWVSILVGLTTSLILFCGHFHQIEEDKAVGKISPLVRLGAEAGSNVVKMSVVGLYSLVLTLGFTKTLPLASVALSAMTLPLGTAVVSFVQKNNKDKSKIFMGKYFCVRLHAAFGAALAAGLVGDRMFAKQQLPQALSL